MVSLLPPSSEPPYITRLKRLRDRERAWKNLAWTGSYNLKLPPTGSVYEFVGGLYGNGREDDRRVTASISFMELPTGPPGCEDGLKSWTHLMSDVTIIDFTMDPSQDLLVLIALATPDSGYVYDLHLRSLSTNEPHPKAPFPVLSCLLKASPTHQASEHMAAVRVQVSGDLVALLVKEVHDSVGAHLELWDWINRPQVSCKMTRVSGIDDFTFLSKDAFLVVRPTGNFEVYTFQNPIIEGAAPACQASYGFPPLSDGYMYWYITMSSNPAPGSIPRPQPGPDAPGKPIYHPKPDERIHACCLYIFNPATDDDTHRVHCFVFFVNLHTLLHPPPEWHETTRARYLNIGKTRARKLFNPSRDTDNSDIASPQGSPASSTSTPSTPSPHTVPSLYVSIASPATPLTTPSQSATAFPPFPPPAFHPYTFTLHPSGNGAHPPGTPTPLQIPWSVWGPQTTRWFPECFTTDWQHSIYGLRTIESVTPKEINSPYSRRVVVNGTPPMSPPETSVGLPPDDGPLGPASGETGNITATTANEEVPIAVGPSSDSVSLSSSSTLNAELTSLVSATTAVPVDGRGGSEAGEDNDDDERSTGWRHLRLRDYNPYSIAECLQEQRRLEEEGDDGKGKGKAKASWCSPRVVTSPTTTNVRGVFRQDVTSWLPYMEVISENLFEVTDVMMDDSRMLLLKVRVRLLVLSQSLSRNVLER
ncbi:hypothetical protein DXG03_005947 [Asterophora parasitica]|uniref:Uncharacterized protein n=1 Tax=Asterophora parasitica TaxID=117018 RepID=A0A9P7G2X9_9AGAR|nr:hypothetical protein DXG03_005947 [Asterophora parasitica]